MVRCAERTFEQLRRHGGKRSRADYRRLLPIDDSTALYGLEQALTKTLLTIEEQETLNCEFKMSALQRANIASRYDSYSKALQNGFMTRNEVRKLENLPTVDGADALTAQNNLVPLDRLGEQTNTDQTPLGDPIKQ